MKDSEFLRIKQKIVKIEPTRYWGDDFDVRFYVASQITNLKNKSILDVGGGIGIISSIMNKSNLRINLDSSLEDLKICKNKTDDKIENICASMTYLPFKNHSFDHVNCCHLLEIAKLIDIEKNKGKTDGKKVYPTIEKTLQEIFRVLKSTGTGFLTTPNNAYYKTTKLTFNELSDAILPVFPKAKIFFYNTYPKISNKYRKLNMANVIPKLKSRLSGKNNVINSLLSSKSQNNYSVSFLVEL